MFHLSHAGLRKRVCLCDTHHGGDIQPVDLEAFSDEGHKGHGAARVDGDSPAFQHGDIRQDHRCAQIEQHRQEMVERILR